MGTEIKFGADGSDLVVPTQVHDIRVGASSEPDGFVETSLLIRDANARAWLQQLNRAFDSARQGWWIRNGHRAHIAMRFGGGENWFQARIKEGVANGTGDFFDTGAFNSPVIEVRVRHENVWQRGSTAATLYSDGTPGGTTGLLGLKNSYISGNKNNFWIRTLDLTDMGDAPMACVLKYKNVQSVSGSNKALARVTLGGLRDVQGYTGDMGSSAAIQIVAENLNWVALGSYTMSANTVAYSAGKAVRFAFTLDQLAPANLQLRADLVCATETYGSLDWQDVPSGKQLFITDEMDIAPSLPSAMTSLPVLLNVYIRKTASHAGLWIGTHNLQALPTDVFRQYNFRTALKYDSTFTDQEAIGLGIDYTDGNSSTRNPVPVSVVGKPLMLAPNSLYTFIALFEETTGDCRIAGDQQLQMVVYPRRRAI